MDVFPPMELGIYTAHLGVTEMLFRNLGMCMLVLLTPLALAAQEKAKTLEDLARDVQNLQSQLKETAENLTIVAEQVTKNTASTANNDAELKRIQNVVNEELRKQQELIDTIEGLTGLQQNQLEQQQQVLDTIAGKDSSGNDVLRLSATMAKSDEFRQDVRKAVNDSLDQEGEVIVQNRMQSYQRIKVNQTEYGIPVGETLTLKVPVGTVTAQLPGQRLTNWTLTAPNYKQRIDIVPDTEATVTAYRPVYTQPTVPLYTSPVETYYVDPLPNYTLPPISWYLWPY